ncbi:MAG TPA: sigma-70 family RNA polymerase sigma factor [Polyangia bacterium]|nr:sigma-70 family RNA polymerase sigma factor [Polyangia bacterium]
MRLTPAYVAGGGRSDADPLELESTLIVLCARGREAHPGLAVDDEVFARHLGRCVASAPEPPPSLDALEIEDLFLACACVAGVPGAPEAFDARCGEKARQALATSVKDEDERAEVAQRVREAVLVGGPDAPPKIVNYAGQGPLDRWVAVVAQRMAVTLVRGETAARRAHERAAVEAATGGQHAPEVALAKEQYRADFERALEEALQTLGARDRMLMRLHLVSGVSVEGIGKMYNVSQSTASRWLAAARDAVAAEVQRLLGERLRLGRSEMASLAGLVASQLDLSMSRILR